MPIYEYECKDHGKFEMSKSFKESDLPQECPQCKELSSRILSNCSVVYVGSGFYQTDYKNKKLNKE